MDPWPDRIEKRACGVIPSFPGENGQDLRFDLFKMYPGPCASALPLRPTGMSGRAEFRQSVAEEAGCALAYPLIAVIEQTYERGESFRRDLLPRDVGQRADVAVHGLVDVVRPADEIPGRHCEQEQRDTESEYVRAERSHEALLRLDLAHHQHKPHNNKQDAIDSHDADAGKAAVVNVHLKPA